jgi:hypothetical protein
VNKSIAVAAAAFGGLLAYTALSSRYSVLPVAPAADWIACARPVNLGVWPRGDRFAYFQTRLVVGARPERARLMVRALRDASVRVDARELLAPRADLSAWREPRAVDLAPALPPGAHTLTLVVMDRDGPPAVWARAPDIGLATSAAWSSSCDGKTWAPARLASRPAAPDWLADAPTPGQGLRRALPWLLAAAALAWLLGLPESAPPGAALGALLAYWALLAALSLLRMPEGVGFDADAHVEYARLVLEKRALPLATQGWQAFQPPLYYLLGALLGAGDRALRALNLLAGAGLVVAASRFLARALPGRRGPRAAGLLVAGLLPAALASSQLPGNEPLAALLTALTLCEALRWLEEGGGTARLGAVWGASLLAKATPALLAPALLLAAVRRRAALLRAAAAAALVCGWYYLWVWARLGAPFVGGWDPSRGHFWWQDPGCRSLADLSRFGAALRQPVYAGLAGFWDGLYSTLWADGWLSGMTTWVSRPPWRYGALEAGAWLALLPSALILAGAARAARGALGAAGRLALSCGAVYLGALVWMFLRLPAYSAVKASYLLGLSPALGLLAAGGLDALPKGRARRLAGALLCAWALTAAAAYLCVRP